MSSRPVSEPKPAANFDLEDDFNDDAPYGLERSYGESDSLSQHKSMHAKRLMLDLLGRWHWVTLGLILGALGAMYYLSKAPKKYSATSSLLIKQETATVMNRKDQVEEIDMRSVEGLNTVAERIRRHDLLERVASRMDVRALPGLVPPKVDWTPEWLATWLQRFKPGGLAAEKAISDAKAGPPAPTVLSGYLGSWMTISIRRGTRLVDINFKHEVPEVAKALADAVAREYLADIASALIEGRSSQSDTLLKQSEEARTKLQAAESALANYARALDAHKTLELQEKTATLLARRYKSKHPKMIAAQSELKETTELFLKEFTVAIASPADVEYWKTVTAAIDASKGDADTHLRLARQLLLSRTGVLKGETASQMSVFNAMLTRLQESDINRQGESSSAEINSFALVPGAPIAPIPATVIAAGCGGGLALGLLLAYALVRMDNVFHSVAQVEAETNVPVLAAVSVIDLRHLDQAVKAASKRGRLQASSPGQEGWEPHLLFRPGTSSTSYAEMFRILRASVSLLGDETKRKITLFSSALPGEGKSFMSANFALAAAGQGRKTLLIDLDLRKPSLHRLFGYVRSEMGPGITDWLAGQATLDEVILHESGADNLDVIFSGKNAPNPGELLNLAKLKQLFAEVRSRYDCIVLDTAPLLAVPDTRVLVPLADNMCLVVRAEYVPKGATLRTLELLNSGGSPPSGLVVNGYIESRRMIGQNYSYGAYRMSRYGKSYRYGYGSYGAYGSDAQDEEKKIVARRKKRSDSK
jgi:capsular exopolysaccharide synthesis family protein